MKRKLIIIIVAVSVCVIAFCILFLTGVIKFDKEETVLDKSKAIAYIDYLDSFVLVDKDYLVYGSQTEEPTGIPKVAGVDFSKMVVGEKMELLDEGKATYAMDVVDSLRRNSILVDQVFVSNDMTATIFVNNIHILMGKNVDTEEKIHDLRDFFDEVKNLNGTLNMQELSQNNIGYSFKTN